MGEEAGHDVSVSLPVLSGGLLVQFGEVLLWHWHTLTAHGRHLAINNSGRIRCLRQSHSHELTSHHFFAILICLHDGLCAILGGGGCTVTPTYPQRGCLPTQMVVDHTQVN